MAQIIFTQTWVFLQHFQGHNHDEVLKIQATISNSYKNDKESFPELHWNQSLGARSCESVLEA